MPIGEALVTVSGLFGDSQRNRKYHGGPMRAVCVFSLERITEMRHEGHPIDIGTTGENITVAGLDWDLVRPGARLEAGEALLEVTDYTKPCRTIRESFEGFHFIRMSQKLYPGWSRVYARVLREGVVRTGDAVSLRLRSTGSSPLRSTGTSRLRSTD
jgi:MOSC domain-containing protein YiiM